MRISDWSSDVCSSDLRMNKAQMGRVQCLPREIPRFQHVRQRFSGAAIDRIADEWMADMRHVDADLMGAPGFEPAFDQGRIIQRDRKRLVEGTSVPRRVSIGGLSVTKKKTLEQT